MVHIRRLVQLVVFLLFLALLVHAAAVVETTVLPAEAVLRLSPLSGITTMLATARWIGAFLPALVVLVLAVVFGRFFCGWVCPLGSTLDACDHVLTPARKGRKPTFYDGRRLKYYLLAFLAVGAPLGIVVAGWFDPLSIVTRSFSLAVVPYVTWLSESVGLALQDLPTGPLGQWWQRGSRAVLAEQSVPIYQYHATFFLLLLVLVGLGIWYRRYWCRNLCPLGALLGLVSGKNVLRRSVSDACIACHKCERVCPMGCITDDGKATMTGECILCMRCQAVCPTDAIRFLRRQPAEQHVPVDMSKRGFLATMGATAAALPLLGSNVPRRRTKDRLTVLRPPGAQPEEEFLARCVRCGECMRICPTRALQPTAFESGIEGLWTPQLVPRIGYCVYNCNLCTQVCPSDAIEPLTLESKHTRALGKAKFNRSRCIPWRGYARFREGMDEWEDANCGTCEEACPVPGKAIRYTRFTGKVGDQDIHIDRPYVVEDLCVGCGFCENVCPVAGEAAVRVEGPPGEAEVEKDMVATAAETVQDWSLEGWSLDGEPVTYAGPERLWEYINGAGEPYLTYDFMQVTVVRYKRDSDELKVELWQFGAPGEAFGAYSRDCSVAATRTEDLGGAAGSGEGEVWVWTGVHYLHVMDPNYMLSRDVLLGAARDVVSRLPKLSVEPPHLVQALPEEGRVAVTVQYFHHPLVAPEVLALPRELVGAKGLHIRDEAPAAFAQYGSLDSPTHATIVVSYGSEAAAKTALDRCRKLYGDKELLADSEDALTIQVEPKVVNAFIRDGKLLGGILRAGSAEKANQAVQDIAQRLSG